MLLELVIDLSTRTMCVNEILYPDNPSIECYEIAIGSPNSPTPIGDFTFKRIVKNPQYVSCKTGANHGKGFLGEWAIETTLLGVGGCPIGIHGTNQEHSIGSNVTGGCNRLHNHRIEHFIQNYADYIIFGKVVDGSK